MKNIIISILTFFALNMQAQEPVIAYRTEKGEDSTTVYVVQSYTRIFPDGLKYVEERWSPVAKDSLKSYVAVLEKNEDAEVAKAEKNKQDRAAAREEIRKIKKEIDKKDGKPRDVALPPETQPPTTPAPKPKAKAAKAGKKS